MGDGFHSSDGAWNNKGYFDPSHDYSTDYYGKAPSTLVGPGYLTYQLVGSKARESYTMNLEVLSGGTWTPYATWKVVAGVDNYTDNHYVGVLNPSSQWRITCGDVTAAVSVLGR